MYSQFGVDIERVNLDPYNELDLSDDDRADMNSDVVDLYVQHAENVLNSWCSDGEFSVFPNGEIHVNIDADLEVFEDNWDLVSDRIGMGPDADVLDDLLYYYAEVAEAGEHGGHGY